MSRLASLCLFRRILTFGQRQTAVGVGRSATLQRGEERSCEGGRTGRGRNKGTDGSTLWRRRRVRRGIVTSGDRADDLVDRRQLPRAVVRRKFLFIFSIRLLIASKSITSKRIFFFINHRRILVGSSTVVDDSGYKRRPRRSFIRQVLSAAVPPHCFEDARRRSTLTMPYTVLHRTLYDIAQRHALRLVVGEYDLQENTIE